MRLEGLNGGEGLALRLKDIRCVALHCINPCRSIISAGIGDDAWCTLGSILLCGSRPESVRVQILLLSCEKC